MEKVKKFFREGVEMSWGKLVVFSVVIGVIGGVIALVVPEKWSLHNIAVCFEAWIVLAMLVITGAKKPVEAGIKVFLFFLITQPLIYLVQVPFNFLGWGIFGYYKRWFIWTLLTLPAGYVCWYIKRGNWLSVAVCAVIATWCGLEGTDHLMRAINDFPYQMGAAILCYFLMVMYPMVFLEGAMKRIVPIIVAVIITGVMNLVVMPGQEVRHLSIYVGEEGVRYEVIYADEGLDVKTEENRIEASSESEGRYEFLVRKYVCGERCDAENSDFSDVSEERFWVEFTEVSAEMEKAEDF